MLTLNMTIQVRQKEAVPGTASVCIHAAFWQLGFPQPAHTIKTKTTDVDGQNQHSRQWLSPSG